MRAAYFRNAPDTHVRNPSTSSTPSSPSAMSISSTLSFSPAVPLVRTRSHASWHTFFRSVKSALISDKVFSSMAETCPVRSRGSRAIFWSALSVLVGGETCFSIPAFFPSASSAFRDKLSRSAGVRAHWRNPEAQPKEFSSITRDDGYLGDLHDSPQNRTLPQHCHPDRLRVEAKRDE